MASEAVLATLEAGWNALDAVDVPKAVIGGLALSAWNHARYTRDADVLVSIDQRQVDAVIKVLSAAGFHPRHDPPLRVIDGQGIVQFMFQPPGAVLPFQFDVLLATSEHQRDSVARAVLRRLPGGNGSIRVVRADDLIIIKLLAGRMIDLADAAMLLRENRDDMDLERLSREIVSHGLQKEYRTIWGEAFPNDPAAE
jgi:hypothetical protein